MSLPNQRQEISPMEGQQHVDNQTVGLVDLGNPSHMKRRKQRSGVWKHFEKYRDEDGKDRAKCNLCEKVFDGSSIKGTTHLWNHFKICQRRRNGSGGGGGDKPAEAGNITNLIAIKEKSGVVEQLNRLDMARKIIRECDFISLHSIKAADIIDVYSEEKEKFRKHFKKLSCRFCLRIVVAENFFGKFTSLMVHFIDDDWKLKKKLISVKIIKDYQNLMKCFKNELLELGIDNNISFLVIYDPELVMSSDERENWFGCQGSLLFNSNLIGINHMPDIDDCYESVRLRYTLFISDRIWSVLYYIMETPSKTENFKIAVDRARSMGQEVNVEVIPTKLQLEKLNTKSCDYEEKSLLLKIALGLKEAFFELENIDPQFKSINLTKEEWDGARLIYQGLCDDTLVGHQTSCQTANMYFPTLCSFYILSHLLAKYNFIYYDENCIDFVQVMDKCWGKYKLILTVAAVLDPRFKMDIVKHWYEKIYGGECEAQLAMFMDYLTDVYNEYTKGTNNFKSCMSRSEGSSSSISYKMLDPSGKLCESSRDLDHVRSSNFELHLYLEDVKFPRIEDFDVLEWWRDNTRYFPTLARMARDFLSIQISTTIDENDQLEELFYAIDLAEEMNLGSDRIIVAFACSHLWLREGELGM